MKLRLSTLAVMSGFFRSTFQDALARTLAYFGLSAPSRRLNHPTSPTLPEPPPSATDSPKETLGEIQREIRAGRQFSIAEAIAREGGSFMKGESTIPRPLRAIAEIKQFLGTHLNDPAGALCTTLHSWASEDIRLSRQLDTPLIALAQVIASLLAEPTTFEEFARQVAIAHGQITGDRPQFQQFGQPPDPAAAHTHQSIQTELSDLLQQLQQYL